MNIRVQAIGKPALAYARDGIAEYRKRLGRHTRISIDALRDESKFDAPAAGLHRVILDERGVLLDTAAFTGKITAWEANPAIKTLVFQIGGSDGHSQPHRDSADFLLALTPLTLQHELALVVLLEQIYRAYMIKAGAPYHR